MHIDCESPGTNSFADSRKLFALRICADSRKFADKYKLFKENLWTFTDLYKQFQKMLGILLQTFTRLYRQLPIIWQTFKKIYKQLLIVKKVCEGLHKSGNLRIIPQISRIFTDFFFEIRELVLLRTLRVRIRAELRESVFVYRLRIFFSFTRVRTSLVFTLSVLVRKVVY